MENSNVRKHHPRANDVSAETRITDHTLSAATHQAVNDEHSNAIDRGFKTQSLRADLLAAPHPSSTNLDGGQTHPTPSPLLLAASLPTPKIDVAPDNCQSLNNALLAAPHPSPSNSQVQPDGEFLSAAAFFAGHSSSTNLDGGESHPTPSPLLLAASLPTPKIDVAPDNCQSLNNALLAAPHPNRTNRDAGQNHSSSNRLLLVAQCPTPIDLDPGLNSPTEKTHNAQTLVNIFKRIRFNRIRTPNSNPTIALLFSLMLLLTAACSSKSSPANQPPVTKYAVSTAPLCDKSSSSFVLAQSGGNIPAAGGPIGRTIQLARSFTRTVVAATLQPGFTPTTANYEVTVPEGFADGEYTVEITEAGQVTNASGTVKIIGPPTITNRTGFLGCISTSPAPQPIAITGTNLTAGATIKLQKPAGSSLSVTIANKGVDAFGRLLNAEVPAEVLSSLDENTPYSLVVETSPGCSGTSQQTFTRVSAPSVMEVVYGPKLYSNKVSRQLMSSVQISGTNLFANTTVKIGSTTLDKSAITPDASNTQLKVELKPNTLEAGDNQAIVVQNGASCSTTFAKKLSVDGSTPIAGEVHFNPSAVANNEDGKSFLDIYGLSGSAALAPTQQQYLFIAINTQADPLKDPIWTTLPTPAPVPTSTSTPVPSTPGSLYVKLNAKQDALRFLAPKFTTQAPPPGQYDTSLLIVNSNNTVAQEVFIPKAKSFVIVPGAAALAPSPVPRIVYKDKDWVKTNGTDPLTIYGCGFPLQGTSSTTVTFTLLDKTNTPTSFTLTGTASKASPWAKSKFRCSTDPANTVTQEVSIAPASFSAITPGIYRLRATGPSPATVSDDSYPFVVYAAGGPSSIGAFQPAQAGTTPAVLGTARKNAQAAVAADATGRKYVYVIGGSMVSSLDPSDGGGITTYEYSALDPDHGLVGFEGTFALVGDTVTRNCSGGFCETYGGALLSDGTLLYWLGGTSSSSTDCGMNNCKAMRQASVVDPTATAATLPFGQLGSFMQKGTLAAGTYGAKALLVTRPNNANPPVNVRKILYFGGYTTKNMLLDNTDQMPILQTIDVGDNGLVNGSTVNPLEFPMISAKPAPLAPLPQAPGSLNYVHGASDTLYASLGVFAGGMVSAAPTSEAQSIQIITVETASNCKDSSNNLIGQCSVEKTQQAVPPTFPATNNAATRWRYVLSADSPKTLTSNVPLTNADSGCGPSSMMQSQNKVQPCAESGFGYASFGPTTYVFGGSDRFTSDLAKGDDDTTRPRRGAYLFTPDAASPLPVTSTSAPFRRLALSASVTIAPLQFLLAGVGCSADDQTPAPAPSRDNTDCAMTRDRAVTPTTEQALLNPN